VESALIVSYAEKGTAFLSEMLSELSIQYITVAHTCGEARRLLLQRDVDLVVINAPLCDESGEGLAHDIAHKAVAQVILIVKGEFFEAMSDACESDGIMVVAKPLHRPSFWLVLKLASSAHSRLKRAQDENSRLRQKIEDIRIIDRAKCVLISCLSMDEQQAHRYIEKQAMDMRSTKRIIAEGILKTYEN
jgi:response regulator NasT